MPNKLFASMGLTICAFVFIILVFIMYLSKKKFRALENNVFLLMFVLTFFLLINEFLYIYAMYAELDGKIHFIKTKPLCYIYILGCIVWFVLLILYIWAIGKKDENTEKFKKEKKRMYVLLSILAIFMLFISVVLPLSYPTGKSNLYVFSGPAVYTIYAVGIFVLVMIIISIVKRGANIPNHQRIPIYFCLFILVIINSIQLIFDLDFNSLTFLYTFVITTLYFTIESQDYKLVDDLEKKRIEYTIADKAQTDFLTNMSHEIRTPLNTILGFSDSLLSEKDITEESVNRDVSMIHSASLTLLDLINNILDISRLESGKEIIDEREYNLNSLIDEIEDSMAYKMEDKKITFSVDVNNSIPSSYHGDYQKILKILVCILNNAIKYTSFGNISLNINGKKIEDNYFEFTYIISNSGHEMSYEKFNIDFNDYVKLGSGDENIIDSETLGLILSKRLIDLLGGKIEFENKPNEGTKYIVKLKQKILVEEKIGNINQNKDSNLMNKIDCSGKKILVVDDNSLNLKLACRLLGEYNFTIDTAVSGKECINMTKNNKYDAIFLDHMMSQMDGVETFKILKSKIHSLPPVIVLTANSSSGLREKYISMGFYDYLSKPIDIKRLNELINKMFDGKKVQ